MGDFIDGILDAMEIIVDFLTDLLMFVWSFVITVTVGLIWAGVTLTTPVWLIPYLIWRKRKYR